jgi:hypothetical protein
VVSVAASRPAPSAAYDLSVVIAVQDGETALAACLASLREQRDAWRVEVLVVDNSRGGAASVAERELPDARLLKVEGAALVPHLWAIGARAASGAIVALTTSHFVPDPGWVSEIARHMESPYAAVGGVIENAKPSSGVRWAVYFTRYAAYMPPLRPGEAAQVPGDNAAYQRWVIDRYAALIAHGFWENTVNDHLRRDGHRLFLSPEVKVVHRATPGAAAFCRQRFAHGRVFGAERVASAGPARRFLRIVTSPVIPAVYLARIAGHVLGRGGHRAEFALALPLVVLFTLCWACGELAGYLFGMGRGAHEASSAVDHEPARAR